MTAKTNKVSWSKMIKFNDTKESQWTAPKLKLALQDRGIATPRGNKSALFLQLLDWNKQTFGCLDPSIALCEADKVLARWTPEQLRVALFFREQDFLRDDSKAALFDQLLAWDLQTFLAKILVEKDLAAMRRVTGRKLNPLPCRKLPREMKNFLMRKKMMSVEIRAERVPHGKRRKQKQQRDQRRRRIRRIYPLRMKRRN